MQSGEGDGGYIEWQVFLDEQEPVWLGWPYKWGGTGYNEGVDCSHWVWRVYGEQGFNYAYQTTSQMQTSGMWKEVGVPQPGMLVLYDGHVGIYYGSDQVISALGNNDVGEVRIHSLASGGSNPRFLVWNGGEGD